MISASTSFLYLISFLSGIAVCYSTDLLTLDQLYLNVLLLLGNLYDQPGMGWDGMGCIDVMGYIFSLRIPTA